MPITCMVLYPGEIISKLRARFMHQLLSGMDLLAPVGQWDIKLKASVLDLC